MFPNSSCNRAIRGQHNLDVNFVEVGLGQGNCSPKQLLTTTRRDDERQTVLFMGGKIAQRRVGIGRIKQQYSPQLASRGDGRRLCLF